ncbi:peptidase S24 LexA-like protein [Campylobacter pinnipediorum subsp. caledonicus]|uniref:Peptidase S24 LexA-like protein n=2 Tax=Campylobacter pinnipediorum TaxID=1965231 RepID=A0A1S6U684_9BACT|nr:S24 family peptidase [Campylobacter pinnipediorum]AQW87180.1 peptidase S24 LexA-like protein [Campylobacter pinnipediorum subsp. caledonicus]OPA71854.1 hypothetical protein BB381_06880 [Campylobacter pinnipediorum subsp. caledonicus]OPA77354.1 hypothetical protein BFG04_04470 [Campylobacter pinnipediorum subsp. pinnipediorum]
MADGIKYSIVEEALEIINKTNVDFYKYIGLTRQQDNNNKKVGYYPIKYIKEIASFFNVSADVLLDETLIKTLKEKKNGKHKKPIKTITNDNTVNVPFFKNGVVSAGFGNENDDMGDYELLPFNPEDLKIMFNVSPNAKIGIIPCFGNSMEPTIKESDLIAFCVDGADIVEGAIYICKYDNELFVKRIKKRPKLALLSDNKDYEPILVDEALEVQIIGRVVGCYSINSKRI